MNFVLFIALNAVLLIRPEELVPDIAGLRLYLIVIGLCLLVAAPQIIETLQPDRLVSQPITVCVLGVWAAGIVSQLARGQFGLASDFAGVFGKIVLYYLLLVSVIDTPGRLRTFLGCIVAIVVVQSGLAVLQYHEVIDNPALRPLERVDGTDDLMGEQNLILQLRGTGIYNDPNDLCLLLVTGIIAGVYRATSAANLLSGLLWLAPVGLFVYGILLTQSRGGLLGLLAAAAVLAYGRYGWRITLLVVLACIPAVAMIGGRQSQMSLNSDDTAHTRAQLWSDGFVEMMRNPITGIGVDEYAENVGQVAHNSFVNAYVEMGILGGSAFLALFLLSAVGVLQARPGADATIRRLQPFLLAIIVGYVGGAFSLSRTYVVTTYLIVGLATAYLRFVSSPAWFRFDGRLAVKLLGVGIAGFIALKLLTRILLQLA